MGLLAVAHLCFKEHLPRASPEDVVVVAQRGVLQGPSRYLDAANVACFASDFQACLAWIHASSTDLGLDQFDGTSSELPAYSAQ